MLCAAESETIVIAAMRSKIARQTSRKGQQPLVALQANQLGMKECRDAAVIDAAKRS
jgi:hypothetical protein